MLRAARASSATDEARSSAPRHELRIAGEKTQQVDVFQDADEIAIRGDRHPALVVPGHLEKGGRDEIVGRDAYDRPVGERRDRAFDRPAVEDRRVEEVRARQDADAFGFIAHEDGV